MIKTLTHYIFCSSLMFASSSGIVALTLYSVDGINQQLERMDNATIEALTK
jgi:hypothetical protein